VSLFELIIIIRIQLLIDFIIGFNNNVSAPFKCKIDLIL